MKRLLILSFFIFCFAFALNAKAMSVIRDTETEELLLGYIRPIFKAAGLNPENAEVVIINDPTINAFVAGGQTIFVHTGLLLKANVPDEAVFVLSHETGHIVGGHIVRGYQALQDAQTTALISTVLGGVLAVVGGRPDAGIAVMMGGQTSAMGLFTKYRQTEESSADRTAVDILNKTGYSMLGFEGIMKSIKSDERLNNSSDNGYLRTHPMTQTRVNDMQRFLKNAKPTQKEEKFDLVKAKLSGFLLDPETVFNTYSGNSIHDRYAQSIAFYRQHKYPEAFQKIDTLISEKPDNPYFYELKGQLFFETGKLSSAEEFYKKAYELKQEAVLFRLSYAQVLLEQGGEEKANQAEKLLQRVVQKEPESPFGWQLLAKAYDRQRKNLEADYAMTEYYSNAGKTIEAQKKAKKIISFYDENSVFYQRLKDIIDIGDIK